MMAAAAAPTIPEGAEEDHDGDDSYAAEEGAYGANNVHGDGQHDGAIVSLTQEEEAAFLSWAQAHQAGFVADEVLQAEAERAAKEEAWLAEEEERAERTLQKRIAEEKRAQAQRDAALAAQQAQRSQRAASSRSAIHSSARGSENHSPARGAPSQRSNGQQHAAAAAAASDPAPTLPALSAQHRPHSFSDHSAASSESGSVQARSNSSTHSHSHSKIRDHDRPSVASGKERRWLAAQHHIAAQNAVLLGRLLAIGQGSSTHYDPRDSTGSGVPTAQLVQERQRILRQNSEYKRARQNALIERENMALMKRLLKAKHSATVDPRRHAREYEAHNKYRVLRSHFRGGSTNPPTPTPASTAAAAAAAAEPVAAVSALGATHHVSSVGAGSSRYTAKEKRALYSSLSAPSLFGQTHPSAAAASAGGRRLSPLRQGHARGGSTASGGSGRSYSEDELAELSDYEHRDEGDEDEEPTGGGWQARLDQDQDQDQEEKQHEHGTTQAQHAQQGEGGQERFRRSKPSKSGGGGLGRSSSEDALLRTLRDAPPSRGAFRAAGGHAHALTPAAIAQLMEHVFFRVRGDAAPPATKAQSAKRPAHQQHLQPLLAPPAPPRPLTTPDESAFERHRRRDADETAEAADVQQQQRQRRQGKGSSAAAAPTASPAKRSTLSPIRSPSRQQLAAARRRAARHAAAAAAAGSHHGRDGAATTAGDSAAAAPASSSSWPHSSDPTHERSLSSMSSSSMQGDEYAQLRREEVLVERQVDEALFAQQRAQVEAEMAAQAARARGEDRRAQTVHKDDSVAPIASASSRAAPAAAPAPAAALVHAPAISTFDVPASELVDLDGEEDAEPDDPFDEQKCLTTPLNVKSLMQFMKPVNSSKKIFPQQD